MSRKVLIAVFSVLIVVLVVMLAAGVARGRSGVFSVFRPQQPPAMTEAYDFPAAEIRSIELSLSFDDVQIEPGSGDTLRVEQWTDGSLSEPRKLHCELRDGALSASTAGVSGSSLFSLGPTTLSRVTIRIPAGMTLPVRAAVGAGDLDVRDLQFGDLTVDSGAGNITLSGVSAEDAEVHTAAGDIDLRKVVCRRLDCSSAVGNIDVAETDVEGDVYLDSSSGDQQFAGSCASCSGSASAGDVKLEVSGVSRVTGSSSAGDVEISCPDTAGLERVSASTSLGNVTVGLAAGSKVSLAFDRGLGDLELEKGAEIEIASDGIVLDVHTGAGDLVLRSV